MISELNTRQNEHYYISFLINTLISIITIFNITGSGRIIVVIIAAILFLLIDNYSQLLVLLFLTGFAADIDVSVFGVPYITVLQILFICKIFISKRYVSKNAIALVMILFILQLPSLLFAGQTIVHILTFAVNILIIFSIEQIDNLSEERYEKCLLTFALGIVVVIIASIIRDPRFFGESYYRFKGIWTDQNFLAMFCALAIMALYYWLKGAKQRVVFVIPLFAILFYCAYRTYSMTFIFASALLIILIVMDFIKSPISMQFKIIGLIIFLIVATLLFSELYGGVISGRGRAIYAAGEDWTHGRFRDTGIVYSAWNSNIINIMFGIGVDNSVAYTGYAAHNSYVELLAQFGITGAVVIIISIIKFARENTVNFKRIFDKKVGFVFILLMYMGTLSLQSTDIWYLFMGLSVCRLSKLKKVESVE